MEKQTVFIKRYPSKGELPSKRGIYISNVGEVKWCKKHGFYYETIIATVKTSNVKWFFQEIELPSEEEIAELRVLKDRPTNIDLQRLHGFKSGANFILNHLKSNTNETDKI